MSAPIVLPADVYDTLELSAYAFDGIGAGAFMRLDENGNEEPWCAIGHANWAGDDDRTSMRFDIQYAGVTATLNDQAVEAVNIRRRRRPNKRISFEEWCAALDVVRGES